MASTEILTKLGGGDRRSIGKSEEVVEEVLHQPSLFDALFAGLLSDDALIRMRTADAVEKITAVHPEYLQPHKRRLINHVANTEQQEVRWHLAQMFPRLQLNRAERDAVARILWRYLEDKSKIVKTFAMQALVEFALQDADLRPRVTALVENFVRSGSPAMRSRGRKLLERLTKIRSRPSRLPAAKERTA